MKAGFHRGIAWTLRDQDLLFDGRRVAERVQRFEANWWGTLSKQSGFLPTTTMADSLPELVAIIATRVADPQYLLACPVPQSEIDTMRCRPEHP